MLKRQASETFVSEILAHPCRPSRSHWRNLAEKARKRKAVAVETDEKNRLWLVETVASGTRLFLEAYYQLKKNAFLEGWCTLEQAELEFARAQSNPFISDLLTLIDKRAETIALWQSLFPYKYFASPGMIIKRWECSICGKHSTPVAPCGHTRNSVYSGELCYRIIREFEPLEVSIVTDPVQKYSVLQLDYDYSVVQYVLDHVSTPFKEWYGEWTHKRHSHSNFKDRPRNGPCPCNSNLRYAECCLPTEGVRLPHFQLKVEGGTVPGERLILARESDNPPTPLPPPTREVGEPL